MKKDITVFPVIRNSNYGLVNDQGMLITELRYTTLKTQSNGWSVGTCHEDGFQFSELIDTNGNSIYKTPDSLRNFSEGLALTLNNENNRFGFINTSGEYKIPALFDIEDEEGVFYTNSEGFSENKTFVLLNKEITCINNAGDILFRDSQYRDAFRFCNDIALVEDKNKDFFFVSPDNKRLDLVPSGFHLKRSALDNFYGFRNGYCRVYKNGKTTFINTTGNFIFQDKQFSSATDFHEQLSVVKQNEKYGVINITGDFIIEPEYDFIGNFNNGIAPYRFDKIWGLIDNTGKIVVEASVDAETVFEKIENFGMRYSADPFHDVYYSPFTRAKVKKQNGKFQKAKEVYINRTGSIMFDYEIQK